MRQLVRQHRLHTVGSEPCLQPRGPEQNRPWKAANQGRSQAGHGQHARRADVELRGQFGSAGRNSTGRRRAQPHPAPQPPQPQEMPARNKDRTEHPERQAAAREPGQPAARHRLRRGDDGFNNRFRIQFGRCRGGYKFAVQHLDRQQASRCWLGHSRRGDGRDAALHAHRQGPGPVQARRHQQASQDEQPQDMADRGPAARQPAEQGHAQRQERRQQSVLHEPGKHGRIASSTFVSW